MFRTNHAVAVILLLIAALGVSVTLLIQQSINLTALSQSSAVATPNALVNGDKVRQTPQDSSETDKSGEPESDAEQPSEADAHTQSTDAAAEGEGLVNINTASSEELQNITGIGPVTAQRIIDHRTTIGRYTSVDQLLDVKGIGPKTLEKMRGQVTVG